MAADNTGIKKVLLDCVEGSLHANDTVRRGAEERLKALEVTECYGTYLLEIVLDTAHSPPIRLLASVLLRQYVDAHWTKLSDKFVIPETTDSVKEMIRQMVPLGLLESQSKIRKSIAAVISSIAHWDWPEHWPNLFDTLMTYLRDAKGIEGAMSVLTEFVKELTDQHMKEIASIIFPETLRILTDSNTYPSYIRSKAVNIFRTCVRMLVTMSELDKSVLPAMLDPYLPLFMDAFAIALTEPESMDCDYCLKKEIVKTISSLIRHCSKRLATYLPTLLSPIWVILTSSTEKYKETLVGNVDGDDDIDSDGENNGVEAILYVIFDLVQNLISSSSKPLIKNYLVDLIYYTIFYMQLPQEKVAEWISHPSTFACDEDEEAATYTLRVCAQDLLTVTCDGFKAESVPALGQAVNRHLSVGGTDWRIQEACLFAVCTLGTTIAETTDQRKGESFDIHGFVQNIVIPGLSSSDILLVGRCIVLGSNFSTVIDPSLTQDFVRATAECLQPDRTIILRILAVKAISTYMRLSRENEIIKKTLLEVLPGAIDSLVHFATTEPSTSVLGLVLECLVMILVLDEGLTASVGQKMTTLSIACFVKFNGDPIIAPLVEEVVRVLCKNQQCVLILQERFVPTIASVLNNTTSENIAGPHGVALDLLTVIVRGSPLPLNQVLIGTAFPAIINCVTKTDDNTVLQNGGECLRAFIALAPEQVVSYHDAKGISGLRYVVQIACRLLDPNISEFTAALVGKLVTTLITKTGDVLGDQLELLLRAVLSKLQSAETLSVIQNLCMVYAHLFNTQMTATLNFLESFPGPTGKSALHFVMTEWVSRQHMFFGDFDRKVCAVALCKLLHHGLNYPRLAEIEVKGEEIFDSKKANQIQTRSKKGTSTWTVIPLPIKMYKLLVNELAFCNSREDFEADTGGDGDVHGDDDDINDNSGSEKNDEEDDDEDSFGDLFYFDSGSADDQDIANDPLYSINLEEYLKEFLIGLSQQPCYPQIVPHLNVQEKKVLTGYGISC